MLKSKTPGGSSGTESGSGSVMSGPSTIEPGAARRTSQSSGLGIPLRRKWGKGGGPCLSSGTES
eukprot:10286893-Alexandrium_andersonii.AAC.1